MKNKKQTRIIKIIIFLLIALIIALESSQFFRAVVPSSSMLPTLQVQDQLIIKKIQYCKIQRGDLIVFWKSGTLYIKRLIGLPGDIINIDNGQVFINGYPLKEEYVKYNDNYTGQFVVPDSSYFLLGDNRSNSADSRFWINPYFDCETIVGKAVCFIYPKIAIIKEERYEVY